MCRQTETHKDCFLIKLINYKNHENLFGIEFYKYFECPAQTIEI